MASNTFCRRRIRACHRAPRTEIIIPPKARSKRAATLHHNRRPHSIPLLLAALLYVQHVAVRASRINRRLNEAAILHDSLLFVVVAAVVGMVSMVRLVLAVVSEVVMLAENDTFRVHRCNGRDQQCQNRANLPNCSEVHGIGCGAAELVRIGWLIL